GSAALVISHRSRHEAAHTSAEAAPLFPGLRDKVNDVAKIRVKRGAVESVIAKSPDKPTWSIESRANYPAEFDQVRKVIGGLAEAETIEPKTSKPEFYEKLGVGDVDKPGALGTRIELDD